jgi:hypothetical protein
MKKTTMGGTAMKKAAAILVIMLLAGSCGNESEGIGAAPFVPVPVTVEDTPVTFAPAIAEAGSRQAQDFRDGLIIMGVGTLAIGLDDDTIEEFADVVCDTARDTSPELFAAMMATVGAGEGLTDDESLSLAAASLMFYCDDLLWKFE